MSEEPEDVLLGIDMKLQLTASLTLPVPFPAWLRSMPLTTTSSILPATFALPLGVGEEDITMSSSRNTH
jgi:hypothetical protein